MKSQFNSQLNHEAIAKRAYELYLARGCVNGSAEQDWLQAESELFAEMSNPIQKKPKPAPVKVNRPQSFSKKAPDKNSAHAIR